MIPITRHTQLVQLSIQDKCLEYTGSTLQLTRYESNWEIQHRCLDYNASIYTTLPMSPIQY